MAKKKQSRSKVRKKKRRVSPSWRGHPPIEVWIGAAELRSMAAACELDHEDWASAADVSVITLKQWVANKTRVPGPDAWEKLGPLLYARWLQADPLTSSSMISFLGHVPRAKRSDVREALRSARAIDGLPMIDDQARMLLDRDPGDLSPGKDAGARRDVESAACDLLNEVGISAELVDDEPEVACVWPPFSEHVLEFAPELEDHYQGGEFRLAPAVLWSVIRRSGTQCYKAEAIARRRRSS